MEFILAPKNTEYLPFCRTKNTHLHEIYCLVPKILTIIARRWRWKIGMTNFWENFPFFERVSRKIQVMNKCTYFSGYGGPNILAVSQQLQRYVFLYFRFFIFCLKSTPVIAMPLILHRYQTDLMKFDWNSNSRGSEYLIQCINMYTANMVSSNKVSVTNKFDTNVCTTVKSVPWGDQWNWG